ncbi:Mitochondrial inner membrane peptidase complex subunit [Exophiala xenobiotica]|uniref:Mitochondrial inner membrane protease subunit n=1 Tax=Lithohypha guttulata TaxID=1690604 RepID=A0ABR0KE54_9EURO|nr:Mitochondrial inner membrane peptidase complex subunit [Lithohypha guttulata]KAK5321464.1 Mitochondrial inner membrane peptidase complex subunit [Exophiala xenobiotica]
MSAFGPGGAILQSLQRTNRRLGEFLYKYRRIYASGVSLAASGYLFRVYIYNWGDSSGASMYPTIPETRSILFVNKRYAYGRGIQVGDCVQFNHPMFKDSYASKRVIGMPGDYVLRSRYPSATPGDAPLCGITDWRKRLEAERAMDEFGMYEALDEQGTSGEEEWAEPQMIQVPEGHVWLEGDNLSWSRDSRFFGPLPMALITGRSSGYKEGYLSWTSLDPGKGLRKVEEWEMDAVLGQEGTSGKVRGK